MKFSVISLFPDLIKTYCKTSILGRGLTNNAYSIEVVNPRDFCMDNYKRVDDKPYGGGYGMVLKPEPYFAAFDSIEKMPKYKVAILSAQGKKYTQNLADQFKLLDQLILICGHYEGFDERILKLADIELSIGDYILTGGELPALVVIDSVARLLPNVLGSIESLEMESFNNNLLEGPQYTRPPVFKDMSVPDILLSGNHKEIALWRKIESLKKTYLNRPDLIDEANLDSVQKKILSQIKKYLE